MLTLKVNPGERVRIVTPCGETIWVKLIISVYCGQESTRLVFDADRSVQILREKLIDKEPKTERSES